VYAVYTVFLAGTSQNIRSYTVCPQSLETKLKSNVPFSVRRTILVSILKFERGTSPVCFVPLSAQKVLYISFIFKLQFREGSEND